MKVLLVALNARYVHSSLALRYLKSYHEKWADTENEVIIQEFTINDSIERVTAEIYKSKPDIVGFSCYIWNIVLILEIARRLKKVKEDLIILLGGPEVSFEPEKILEQYGFVDYIISGEGERAFLDFLKSFEKNNQMPDKVIKASLIDDLGKIPFPYTDDDLKHLKDKIIYYESSRGCPFRCSYCLSSAVNGVRFMPMERVKTDLYSFIKAEVKQVKFVDRTFNCNKKRAMEIWSFLSEKAKPNMNFHFEICADLLDDEMLDFLNRVPTGLFQFEIGVQSTNVNTIRLINRSMDFEKVSASVKRIAQGENIHQHLDLIAGLPAEDYAYFRKSFNDVYKLKPERIQLGFLKLLKGSPIRRQASEFGYVYTDSPPYEVLKNNTLSYDEILRLKMIEDLLEKYYNTHRFDNALEYITGRFDTCFDFFEEFSFFWERNNLHTVSHSNEALYLLLLDFYESLFDDGSKLFKDILKFDFILHQKNYRLPERFCGPKIKNFKERCFEFLKDEENLKKHLPHYKGLTAKQIYKQVNFEPFSYDVMEVIKNKQNTVPEPKQVTILFDYKTRVQVVQKARAYKIRI